MTSRTTDGACIRVSTETPVSFTASAYMSLDWVDLGQVFSLGGLGGVFNDVASYDLCDGEVTHIKGSFDYNEVPIIIDIDESDAGQSIIEDHFDGNKTYQRASFEVEHQDGATQYWTAHIFNFSPEDLAQDAIWRANISLRVRPASVIKVPLQVGLWNTNGTINGSGIILADEIIPA